MKNVSMYNYTSYRLVIEFEFELKIGDFKNKIKTKLIFICSASYELQHIQIWHQDSIF